MHKFYILHLCVNVKRVNLPTIHEARLVLGYVFGILKEKTNIVLNLGKNNK